MVGEVGSADGTCGWSGGRAADICHGLMGVTVSRTCLTFLNLTKSRPDHVPGNSWSGRGREAAGERSGAVGNVLERALCLPMLARNFCVNHSILNPMVDRNLREPCWPKPE